MLQLTITLSPTKALYMTMNEGIQECIWLHSLVQNLWLKVEKYILFCNNRSPLCLEKNLVYHEKKKKIH